MFIYLAMLLFCPLVYTMDQQQVIPTTYQCCLSTYRIVDKRVEPFYSSVCAASDEQDFLLNEGSYSMVYKQGNRMNSTKLESKKIFANQVISENDAKWMLLLPQSVLSEGVAAENLYNLIEKAQNNEQRMLDVKLFVYLSLLKERIGTYHVRTLQNLIKPFEYGSLYVYMTHLANVLGVDSRLIDSPGYHTVEEDEDTEVFIDPPMEIFLKPLLKGLIDDRSACYDSLLKQNPSNQHSEQFKKVKNVALFFRYLKEKIEKYLKNPDRIRDLNQLVAQKWDTHGKAEVHDVVGDLVNTIDRYDQQIIKNGSFVLWIRVDGTPSKQSLDNESMNPVSDNICNISSWKKIWQWLCGWFAWIKFW